MGGVVANAPGPCACRCIADKSGSYGWMRRCRSADSARWAVLLPMHRAPAPAAVSPMNRAHTGGCGGVGAQILRDGRCCCQCTGPLRLSLSCLYVGLLMVDEEV